MDEHGVQFRWFVTLWVMAFSFHFFDGQPFNAWPVLLAGIPCLLLPGSAALFAIFLAVSGLVVVNDLPAPANHFALGLLVNLAFAAAAVVVVRQRQASDTEAAGSFGASWIEVARAPAGLTLLVVYFFALFHKLNVDFFDPQVSCAGSLLTALFNFQGIDYGWVTNGVVVGNALLTIALEAAILVCLAVPRWRRWGLLFGAVFHFGLAWTGFFDFATFVFALYVLLLPPETWTRIERPERWRRIAIAGWTATAAVSAATYLSSEPATPIGLQWRTLQFATWSVALGAMLVPLLWASFALGMARLREVRWSFRPAWLLILPAVALLNGAAPYLGLKTVPAYSMFSNLRTEEGRTNHFIGALTALQITDFQHDIVKVHKIEFPDPLHLGWVERARGGAAWVSNQTRWANDVEEVRVPWTELRRAALLWKRAGIDGIRIRYERDGVERRVADAAADPELTAPLPWWEQRFLAFRQIEPAGDPVACRW